MEEKLPSFFRFEDLRIYGKAIEYSRWLMTTLREAQTECERSLSKAFSHSAMDIAMNIAEGSSRSKVQFDHYLKISKTAIRECVIYTAVAKGLGMLSEEDSERSRELLMEQTRMIGALIISLQRGSSRRNREDYEGTATSDDFMHDSVADHDFDSTFDDLEN